MLECVLNVSEGRDAEVLRQLSDAAEHDLLDVHRDPHHHRSVFTLVGEEAARAVATVAVHRLDLRQHEGVHPRLGVVDVVPFVPLDGSTMDDAIAARDAFAAWLADAHGVPVFTYGPERSLPEVRRRAFTDLSPDVGPRESHPTAGATCAGARSVLVAYNLWIDGLGLAGARAIASSIRQPALRALGLQVGEVVQVSINLVDPMALGPAVAYELVERALIGTSGSITRAELVGLLPELVLADIDPATQPRLGVGPEQTIEARIASARR